MNHGPGTYYEFTVAENVFWGTTPITPRLDRVPLPACGSASYLRFTRAGPHPAATVAAGARAPARERAAHIVIDGGTDREWREPDARRLAPSAVRAAAVPGEKWDITSRTA